MRVNLRAHDAKAKPADIAKVVKDLAKKAGGSDKDSEKLISFIIDSGKGK